MKIQKIVIKFHPFAYNNFHVFNRFWIKNSHINLVIFSLLCVSLLSPVWKLQIIRIQLHSIRRVVFIGEHLIWLVLLSHWRSHDCGVGHSIAASRQFNWLAADWWSPLAECSITFIHAPPGPRALFQPDLFIRAERRINWIHPITSETRWKSL